MAVRKPTTRAKVAAKPAAKVEKPKAAGPAQFKRTEYQRFAFMIEGTTPLIVHSWSQKAKLEMLAKQLKTVKPGREVRDPEGDYESSLYRIGNDSYGFPVTGLKDAVCDRAHKDKGIARTDVRTSLWLDHEVVRVGVARQGAVCYLPLVRLIAGKPEMREDPVSVGAGLKKTASLAYRGQFWPWAVLLTGTYNPAILTEKALMWLIEDAGASSGIGEWRITRGGVFGAFEICTEARAKAWARFATGKGPIPAEKAGKNVQNAFEMFLEAAD